jgi:hypothetical protein
MARVAIVVFGDLVDSTGCWRASGRTAWMSCAARTSVSSWVWAASALVDAIMAESFDA